MLLQWMLFFPLYKRRAEAVFCTSFCLPLFDPRVVLGLVVGSFSRCRSSRLSFNNLICERRAPFQECGPCRFDDSIISLGLQCWLNGVHVSRLLPGLECSDPNPQSRSISVFMFLSLEVPPIGQLRR
ncbi:hypothetical protein IWZ01DRAFT_493818 [Phyllosticta capitalensis]